VPWAWKLLPWAGPGFVCEFEGEGRTLGKRKEKSEIKEKMVPKLQYGV